MKMKKHFPNFLLDFWILNQILNVLKEKTIVIANVFPKLETVKIFVRNLSQEHRFRTRFDIEHVKASKKFPKYPRERFYHVLL